MIKGEVESPGSGLQWKDLYGAIPDQIPYQ